MAVKEAINRRQFIVRTAQMVGVAACIGTVWQSMVRGEAKAAVNALRPPGALPEADFAAQCLKCGQCVRACPYDTLSLASIADVAPVGTPYFLARNIPCEMCADIPCARVCPSGALDAKFPDIEKARMGVAMIDAENCLSWLGLRCEICYRVCPLRDKAITLNIVERETSKHAKFEPVIHSDACTGCGKCEKACPTEQAAVRVLRPEYVKGKLGEHYRPTLGKDFQTQTIRSGTDIAPEYKPTHKQQAPGMDYFNNKTHAGERP
ncbi:MAG: ferredoxin-type protein NapG [Proteobacteria bacterium]|nr:ferredoxin-type protein NapG [Pseudomonadota bacterium]